MRSNTWLSNKLTVGIPGTYQPLIDQGLTDRWNRFETYAPMAIKNLILFKSIHSPITEACSGFNDALYDLCSDLLTDYKHKKISIEAAGRVMNVMIAIA